MKTTTLAKCGKYSSLIGHRTVSAQYDLTLIMRKRFEIFYARGGRWSFHTAKTLSGHTAEKHKERKVQIGLGVKWLELAGVTTHEIKFKAVSHLLSGDESVVSSVVRNS